MPSRAAGRSPARPACAAAAAGPCVSAAVPVSVTEDMTGTVVPADGLVIVTLGPVDLVLIVVYFVFVLGIGFYLKHFADRSEGFFLAGRNMTAWIAGLAFISANLGALELLGWAANAYEYGIMATHDFIEALKAKTQIKIAADRM